MGAWLTVRPRVREREPAGVHRADLARRAAATSRSTRGCGAAASFPRSTRACSSAAARIRCCTSTIPTGIDRSDRRRMLDTLSGARAGAAREASWTRRSTRASRSTRWRTGCRPRVPEVTDLADEPEHVLDLYGPDARKPGTFAANCLLARRLAERGVRFIQLYHQGWDQHGNLPKDIQTMTKSSTRRPRPWSPTSSSAACSTTRSSSGAASSGGRTTPRAS